MYAFNFPRSAPLKTILLGSIIAASFFASIAGAQDKDKKEEKEKPKVEKETNSDAQEIIVIGGAKGSRRGRPNANNADRKQLENSDSDDIDDFLDDMSGISTLEGDEDGNSFSFQGMSPEMSKMTLNGQDLGGAGINLGEMSTDMVESIEVYKSPAASMEEGASAGSVNVKLRNPANLKNQIMGMRGRLSNANELSGYSPSFSANIGNSYNMRKFGFLAKISYKNDLRISGNLSTKGWENSDQLGDDSVLWTPKSIRYSASDSRRQVLSPSFILGLRPANNLDLGLQMNFQSANIISDSTNIQGMFDRQKSYDVLAVEDDTVSQLATGGGTSKNLRLQLSDRNEKSLSQSYSADMTLRKWASQIKAAVGFSQRKNSYDNPAPSITFSTASDFGYSLHGNQHVPVLDVPENVQDLDYAGYSVYFSDKTKITSNRFADLSIMRRVKDSVFKRIQMGLKYRQTKENNDQYKGTYRFDSPRILSGNTSSYLEDGFLPSLASTPIIQAWPHGNILAEQSYDTPTMEQNFSSIYDVSQTTKAAFIQSDFRGRYHDRPVFGNVGLRVVKTTIDSVGFEPNGSAYSAVEKSSNYTDILPSATLGVRLKNRVMVQIGLARVMTRPRLRLLSSSLRLSVYNHTASTGNADLKPFRANQVMIDTTWIKNKNVRYTLTATYKDVDNFYTQTYTTAEFNDQDYLLSQPVNGGKASILSLYGEAKLKLKPMAKMAEVLKDMSLTASVSYNSSKTDFLDSDQQSRLPVPLVTPVSVKVNLGHAKGKFKSRVRYQWQSKSLRTPISSSGAPTWQKQYGSIDLSTSYQLLKSTSLSFDIRNLFNAGRTTYDDTVWQMLSYAERGRRISLGLKARF